MPLGYGFSLASCLAVTDCRQTRMGSFHQCGPTITWIVEMGVGELSTSKSLSQSLSPSFVFISLDLLDVCFFGHHLVLSVF